MTPMLIPPLTYNRMSLPHATRYYAWWRFTTLLKHSNNNIYHSLRHWKLHFTHLHNYTTCFWVLYNFHIKKQIISLYSRSLCWRLHVLHEVQTLLLNIFYVKFVLKSITLSYATYYTSLLFWKLVLYMHVTIKQHWTFNFKNTFP